MEPPMTELHDHLDRFVKPFRVEPGANVRLPHGYDPRFHAELKKRDAGATLKESVQLLADYQARLAAQDTYGLLVILQAMDAAGKDGTIKHVMRGVNAQGVSVHSFKVPSAEELDHDYLWRYQRRLPARGEIGIFNRSHYEETLVVRVHPELLEPQRLPPEARSDGIWRRRFREINDWEHYLVDNGIRVVKLFLNLSKQEQRDRFLARIDEPDKNWKFSARDVAEREHWDEYQDAFSEVLTHTSTAWAPWHVIPADRKWFARIAAAAVIVRALADIDPRYPVVGERERSDLQAARARLEAES
jgi:PPK2 family polyphosphate:nucleotide phosphotransferase